MSSATFRRMYWVATRSKDWLTVQASISGEVLEGCEHGGQRFGHQFVDSESAAAIYRRGKILALKIDLLWQLWFLIAVFFFATFRMPKATSGFNKCECV